MDLRALLDEVTDEDAGTGRTMQEVLHTAVARAAAAATAAARDVIAV